MSLIGQFPIAGSAVFNLDFLPEYLLINSATADQNLSNFSVVTSGIQLMSVTSAARLTALAKFDSGAILMDPAGVSPNAVTSAYLKLATGRINKATTITGTTPSATALNVFAASTNITNVARRAVEQSVNPSANATFSDFEALIFSTADVLRVQITFDNGFSDEYTPNEINALYSRYHVSDVFGTLEGLACIDADSGAGRISQVVLYNGAGAATVVLKTDYVQL
jgi:uncharacterized protein YerC